MVFKEKRTLAFIAVILALFLGAHLLKEPPRSGNHPAPYAFPATMGQWQGSDLPMDRDLLTSWLGTDNMVFRQYHDESRGYAVSLYLAYYADMSSSDMAHAPEVCYPGQGWRIVANQEIEPGLSARDMRVKRMQIARHAQREVVYSWWQTRDRIIPSNSWYRLNQIISRISRNDSASIWVRISADEGPDDQGEDMVRAFCEEALPLLANYFQPRG